MTLLPVMILRLWTCSGFQINLMNLELALAHLLDQFLDFYMDVLNVYDYEFTSMFFEISVRIYGLYAFWVLNFMPIAVLFCACVYLNGLIVFLQHLQCSDGLMA